MNTFTLERNNYRRKLIMMVKQHTILWNKAQENYNRNRTQKNLAWHQISEQLDISVDKLRRTWENLRDQYRRDLKREVRFGFKSKWRFFADMDFIRDMVTYKEREFKENGFTDSESELDVTDNPNMQTQCSPISTTLVAPTSTETLTTRCSSSIPSNTTAATNILNFQPIMLSKQWQPVAEDLNTTISYHTPNTPPFTTRFVDPPANSDSSKDYNQPSSGCLPYETVAKQEPSLELELDNNGIALEQQQQPTPSTDKQNAGEFQEPRVSTSSNKRSRTSIDCIIDSPIPTTSRCQIKTEIDLNGRDDDYYFVMSLLPSLRQIPRSRKFPLRIGIMSLIAKDLEQVCKEL